MVDSLSNFLFQPVLHDWCNIGCGICYPVCGMMHIKEPLLLVEKGSPCGSTGWNEKELNGSTIKHRSDDPSHLERTLLPRSYISLLLAQETPHTDDKKCFDLTVPRSTKLS